MDRAFHCDHFDIKIVKFGQVDLLKLIIQVLNHFFDCIGLNPGYNFLLLGAPGQNSQSH